jgi:hypothetical protein
MGHGERRRELEWRFPGWEIWYVPRAPDGATWRARPRMLIDAEDPEDLAAAIRAADNPVIPDSALLASRRGNPVRRRRGGLGAPAGSAWRRVKARRTRPAGRPGSPPRVPPGLA